MPGKATALNSPFLHLYRAAAVAAARSPAMKNGSALTPADRALLLRLQCQALQYFLDNQAAHGLMLDRQCNHGPRRPHGLCSTTATGMGFIALAVASGPPYHLISPGVAASRIAAGLGTVFELLPHDHGVVPHFTDLVT